MTTHIDQATTEVIPESEPQVRQESDGPRPDEEGRVARLIQRTRWVEQRTRAEGFDEGFHD